MTLEVDFRHDALAHVICFMDKNKFQQVIMNVIGNAIKFSPKDKPVKVTVQLLRKNAIINEVNAVSTRVAMSAVDTGVGDMEAEAVTGCVVVINVEDFGPGIAKIELTIVAT